MGTFQRYGALRKKDDYAPSVQVKLVSDAKTGEMKTKIFTRRDGRTYPLPWDEVVARSEVTAYITVRGFFVNLNMVAVQIDVTSMMVNPAREASAAELFPEFGGNEDEPPAKRAKAEGTDDEQLDNLPTHAADDDF